VTGGTGDVGADPDSSTWGLGTASSSVDARLQRWQSEQVGERIWRGDPTVWPAAPPRDVTDRLGWLRLPQTMVAALPKLRDFAEEIRAEQFRHVVVLGMGGSSLAPDALRRIFGHRAGYPELLVLDSTHPGSIRALQQRIEPARTLFVVSSKSGTTIEPLSFYRYFWGVLQSAGAAPGPHFIAVTDPGTPLEKLAVDQHFRSVFSAEPDVGGRYSALTMFGLVPAGLAGLDVGGLLDRARSMSVACGATVAAPASPGLRLAATLGELAAHGRDKLTFYAPESFTPFCEWIEQLVAESTGKFGRGILPIVHEPMLAAEGYGSDRLFVEIQDGSLLDAGVSAHTSRLESAGHPVVRLWVRELPDLGAEFFRWEFAVAGAGIVLGINPFDQPDVEFAKELARRAMDGTAQGAATPEPATVPGDRPQVLAPAVKAWLAGGRAGDFVAIQAYLADLPETDRALAALRRRLLERTRLATTRGYGPRFLHSTGQFHKGGPNTGLFLQLIDTPHGDLEVPGATYTFGQLIRAQAIGDYHALRQQDRRVLRVDLGRDVLGGLRRMMEALDG
jgi:transaldolase / glucose-6-phosphate isomerase